MKCRVCREPAVIDVRRHNANFCAEHFLRLCRDQTAKAIKDFAMIQPGERIIIANGVATIERVQAQQQPLSKPKKRTKKKSEGAIEAGLDD